MPRAYSPSTVSMGRLNSVHAPLAPRKCGSNTCISGSGSAQRTVVTGLDDWRVYEQNISLPSADTQSAPRPHVSPPAPEAAGTVSGGIPAPDACAGVSCPRALASLASMACGH